MRNRTAPWSAFCQRVSLVTLMLCTCAWSCFGFAGQIDPEHKFAWAENAGWLNFKPTHGTVTVYPGHLEGYVWAESIGWISLGTHSGGGNHTYLNTAASNYGVNRSGNELSGYAWGKSVGWLNFNPNHGGVTVDMATGDFDGYAWGESIGWIKFAGTAQDTTEYKVKTYPVTYTLRYTSQAGGTITGNASQTVNHGTNGSSVEAVPNTGYRFVGWSDGSTANPRRDNNVTGNIEVTAEFAVITYNLTYTAGSNGTITGSTSQIVNHGTHGSSVEAVPDTGYRFVGWSDGSTTNPRIDSNVTGSIEVTAEFAVITYNLTYTAGANGTITGDTSQIVNHGTDGSSVEAVPHTGYRFSAWSDGLTENPRADLAVVSAISVTALFVLDLPPLSVSRIGLTSTSLEDGTWTLTTGITIQNTHSPDAGYYAGGQGPFDLTSAGVFEGFEIYVDDVTERIGGIPALYNGVEFHWTVRDEHDEVEVLGTPEGIVQVPVVSYLGFSGDFSQPSIWWRHPSDEMLDQYRILVLDEEKVLLRQYDVAVTGNPHFVFADFAFVEGSQYLIRIEAIKRAGFALYDGENERIALDGEVVNKSSTDIHHPSLEPDTTAPRFTISITPERIDTGNVEVRIVSSEILSGPLSVEVTDGVLNTIPAEKVSEIGCEYIYELNVTPAHSEGTVSVFVSGIDNAGNTGTGNGSFTIDRTPPEVTVDLPGYVWEGFLLKLVFDEALSGPPDIGFTDAYGAELSVPDPTVSGFTYTYLVSIPEHAADGEAVLSITAKDLAGNENRITREVVIDREVLDLVVTVPELAGPGLVDMEIEANKTIVGRPEVTVRDSAGKAITVYRISTGTEYAYRMLITNEHLTGPGVISVTAEDLTGRRATVVREFLIDVTGPSLTMTVDPADPPYGDVNVVVTADKELKGAPSVFGRTGDGADAAFDHVGSEGLSHTYTAQVSGLAGITVYGEDTAGNPATLRRSFCDLVLEEGSITLSGVPGRGSDIVIGAVARNDSKVDLASVTVSFYDRVNRRPIGTESLSMLAGASVEFAVNWPAEDQSDRYFIVAVVDPEDKFYETNELNNAGSIGSYAIAFSGIPDAYVAGSGTVGEFEIRAFRLADRALLDEGSVAVSCTIFSSSPGVMPIEIPVLFDSETGSFACSFNPDEFLEAGSYRMVMIAEGLQTGEMVTEEKIFHVIRDYSVSVQTDSVRYDRGSPVEITGEVSDVGGGAVAGARVELILTMRQGTRVFTTMTDDEGAYRFVFNPTASEAGIYDLTAKAAVYGIIREKSTAFTILGLYLSPGSSNVRFSSNGQTEKVFHVHNLGETTLTGIQISAEDMDPGDELNVVADTADTASALAPGAKTSFRLLMQSGLMPVSDKHIGLRVTCEEGAVEFGKVFVTTIDAVADLKLNRSYVEAALNPMTSKRERIIVTNEGYADMENVFISLDGAPGWVSINRNPLLGRLVARGPDRDHGFGLLPNFSLIAKVGEDGTPFHIGSGRTIQADSSGLLWFRVNEHDAELADNGGVITVEIKNGTGRTFHVNPALGWQESGVEMRPGMGLRVDARGIWQSAEGVLRDVRGFGCLDFDLVLSPEDAGLISADPYDATIPLQGRGGRAAQIYLRVWVRDFSEGDLTFHVKNEIDQIVPGAKVDLFDQMYDPVSASYKTYSGKTDQSGTVTFNDLPVGTYRFMVTSVDHYGSTGTVTVSPGANVKHIEDLVKELVRVEFNVYSLEELIGMSDVDYAQLGLIGEDYRLIQDRYAVKIETTFSPIMVSDVRVNPPILRTYPAVIFHNFLKGETKEGSLKIRNDGDLTAFITSIEIPEPFRGGDNPFEFIFSYGGVELNTVPLNVDAIPPLKDGLQPGESVTLSYMLSAVNAEYFDRFSQSLRIGYQYFTHGKSNVDAEPHLLEGRKSVPTMLKVPGGGLLIEPSHFIQYGECAFGPITKSSYDFSVRNISDRLGRPQRVGLDRISGGKLSLINPASWLGGIGEMTIGQALDSLASIVSQVGAGGWDNDILRPGEGAKGTADLYGLDLDLGLLPGASIGSLGFTGFWHDHETDRMKDAHQYSYGIPIIEVSLGCLAEGLIDLIKFVDSLAPKAMATKFSWAVGFPVHRPPAA